MPNKKIILPVVTLMVAATMLGLVLPGYLWDKQPPPVSSIPFVPTMTSSATSTLESQIELPTATPTMTPTPDPAEALNCTYMGFQWQQDPEKWPALTLFGGREYSRQEMVLLYSINTTDLPTQLVREAHTTQLNLLRGAKGEPVKLVLVQASEWAVENPPGSRLSELARELGQTYLTALQNFNEGWTGPPLCADHLPTPMPEPTQTK